MKSLVVLFFLTSTPAFAGGGVFVGNGGDGIEIGNTLYVWDLFSIGVEKTAYFGKALDPYFYLPPQTINFKYPAQLLARKLTDLNRVAPGMGDFVFECMKHYTWVAEDWPLTPIPHPTDAVLVPSKAKFIQIANRLQTTITIHAASWNRLDDANKVALLIHETIYSMVKPTDLDGHFQVQSSRTAQQITAAFFSSSYYAQSPEAAYALLEQSLMIPEILPPLSLIRASLSWTFLYGSLSKQKKTSVPLTKSTNYESLYSFLLGVCSKTGKFRDSVRDHEAYLMGTFAPSTILVSIDKYAVSEGVFQSYVIISVETRRDQYEMSYVFKSVEDCMLHFNDQLVQVAWSLH